MASVSLALRDVPLRPDVWVARSLMVISRFAGTTSSGFAGARIAPLALDPGSSLPCSVQMPERAFADVLTNLLRNALEASLATGGTQPAAVGLSVQTEVDPATGDEHVASFVLDRVPGELPVAALRSRYIEAGLGLTADLVSRYQGTLDVEPFDGWSKAVVLRLPGASSESLA
jgi:hypothetical protein